MKCKYCERQGSRGTCGACSRQRLRGHMCKKCGGPYWPSKRGCIFCIKVTGPITRSCKACDANNFETSSWSYSRLCACCDKRGNRNGWCECGAARFKEGCHRCKEPGDVSVTLIAPDKREKTVWVQPRTPVNGSTMHTVGDENKRIFRVTMRQWLSGIVATPPKQRVRCGSCSVQILREKPRLVNLCNKCMLVKRAEGKVMQHKKLAIPKGRVCFSCGKNDSQKYFRWNDTECHSCYTISRQNGRCVICQSATLADGTCIRGHVEELSVLARPLLERISNDLQQ